MQDDTESSRECYSGCLVFFQPLNGANPAQVMLLMAMKAADATPATAARPEQQSLKRQSSLPAVAVARRHHETAEENLRRRRHPGVAVSDGYQREESARKLPETGCLPVQPPAPVRPLVAGSPHHQPPWNTAHSLGFKIGMNRSHTPSYQQFFQDQCIPQPKSPALQVIE